MRLLSYNIHKGIGGRDRLYRLDRVLEVIRAAEADIVCLQEVDRNVSRSRFDDQPALLQQALGLDFAIFQFNHRVAKGGYGNLVLSRYPIRKKHNISLRYRGRKNRRAQVAIMQTHDGAELRLVNWHLGLGERERHWQVAHLLNHESFRGYADLPTLLTGDSNDWRNTLHGAAIRDHGLRQPTAPPSRFRSFPAYMPVGALDKVFACTRVKVSNAHVVNTALARKASDHLPVLVEFSVA